MTTKRKHSDREKEAEAPGFLSDTNNILLLLLFILAVSLLYMTFSSFPKMPEEDAAKLRLPRSLRQLREVYALLHKYVDTNYWSVVGLFCSCYIFLQTFAIPGAIFLSVLAGPLFGVFDGLLIVSITATCGATLCFLLFSFLGRRLAQTLFPKLLSDFRKKISKHSHNLFFYLLFLRISPLLPNWFINMSSPILNVPLKHFFFATFFGLMPANYIHVTTGKVLLEFQEGPDDGGIPVDFSKLLMLLGLAFLALIPTLLKSKFSELDAKMEEHKERKH